MLEVTRVRVPQAMAEAALLADEEAALDLGSLMVVECPAGVGPGELILIETETGEELEAEVPEGVAPGMEFEVYV